MLQNNHPESGLIFSTKRRIDILKLLVFIALAVITLRLFFIQILEHDHWIAKADQEHTLLETITARRGEIYMMDKNEPVAAVLNQTTYQIVIDPTVTAKEDIQHVLETFAKDYTVANLDEVYSTEGLRYSIVAKGVPRNVIEEIVKEEPRAIWFKKTNQRVYPEGSLGSSMLGFINSDGEGQYGIERSLDGVLSGKDGLLKTTADVNSVALSIGNDNIKIPAENGKDIVLSIDRGLEMGAEEIATKHIEKTAATNAAVLIMDPSNSEVLAMSSLPNYDPNHYSEVTDASAYLNQVTEVPYEPASVCKSFAFSAAINEGVMNANTTYFNQGYEVVDGWEIKNAEQRASLYGTLDMRTALYWSLNTGSIYALKLLGGNTAAINQKGREKLFDYYYNKFRLGQATGIELNEAEGFIPDPNDGWGRDSVYANMTFGQNLGITMIQTATAYSAIVNGGTYRTPTIVKGELKNGTIVPLDTTSTSDIAGKPSDTMEGTAAPEPVENKTEEKILSDETSTTMREMFVNNRDYKRKGGIDRAGYEIGGKSGTAQVIKNGAYDDTMNETIGTYIGFVGTKGELPKYVIMVKMWGDGQHLDGPIASNLFDDISNYVIDYYKVKPKV
ncbi:penicillin-binding protein 2 [Candidatus Saccharibacteria bacterium]|nr:penicillin-binding protein 2 [Candidatus Saccharibacteria bacterium]